MRKIIPKGIMIIGLATCLVWTDPVLGVHPLGMVLPKVRVEAPDFRLESLNGDEQSLAEFKGKVILVNFWATWCAPCREEMPAMQELWNRYKDEGFVIIGVAGDRGNRRGVASFVRKLGLTFPILLDPKGKVRNTYEVIALPWTYLIGRDGKIIGRIPGARDWASAEAHAVIEDLLRQKM